MKILSVTDILKSARRKMGMTQERLSKKLGISQAFVAMVEAGKRIPSGERLLERWAQVLALGESETKTLILSAKSQSAIHKSFPGSTPGHSRRELVDADAFVGEISRHIVESVAPDESSLFDPVWKSLLPEFAKWKLSSEDKWELPHQSRRGSTFSTGLSGGKSITARIISATWAVVFSLLRREAVGIPDIEIAVERFAPRFGLPYSVAKEIEGRVFTELFPPRQ